MDRRLPGAAAIDAGYVLVATVDDLTAMRRASGRPQDVTDIAELEAILRPRDA